MTSVTEISWKTFLLRGAVAIAFALLLLFVPGMTLATGALSFVILFSVYALVEGISTIYSAVRKREGHWVLYLLFGIVGLFVGIWALRHPIAAVAVTVAIMVALLAIKCIVGGLIELVAAWQLRNQIDYEWLLGINGLVSLVFGLLLILRPIETLEVLILFTAYFLLITGAMQVALSFQIRGRASEAVAP